MRFFGVLAVLLFAVTAGAEELLLLPASDANNDPRRRAAAQVGSVSAPDFMMSRTGIDKDGRLLLRVKGAMEFVPTGTIRLLIDGNESFNINPLVVRPTPSSGTASAGSVVATSAQEAVATLDASFGFDRTGEYILEAEAPYGGMKFSSGRWKLIVKPLGEWYASCYDEVSQMVKMRFIVDSFEIPPPDYVDVFVEGVNFVGATPFQKWQDNQSGIHFVIYQTSGVHVSQYQVLRDFTEAARANLRYPVTVLNGRGIGEVPIRVMYNEAKIVMPGDFYSCSGW